MSWIIKVKNNQAIIDVLREEVKRLKEDFSQEKTDHNQTQTKKTFREQLKELAIIFFPVLLILTMFLLIIQRIKKFLKDFFFKDFFRVSRRKRSKLTPKRKAEIRKKIVAYSILFFCLIMFFCCLVFLENKWLNVIALSILSIHYYHSTIKLWKKLGEDLPRRFTTILWLGRIGIILSVILFFVALLVPDIP